VAAGSSVVDLCTFIEYTVRYHCLRSTEFELFKCRVGQEADFLADTNQGSCGFSEPKDGLAIIFATKASAATPMACHLMRSRSTGYPLERFSGETGVSRSETPQISCRGKHLRPKKSRAARKISSDHDTVLAAVLASYIATPDSVHRSVRCNIGQPQPCASRSCHRIARSAYPIDIDSAIRLSLALPSVFKHRHSTDTRLRTLDNEYR
jgi:hypothetical protein